MKRSNWVRLLAVILVISMLAAPISAATARSGEGYRTNSLVSSLVGRIRDIVRDIIDDWFDQPAPGKPIPTKPTTPVEPTEPEVPVEPSEPVATQPVETDPTEPVETDPTEPVVTEPTVPVEPAEPEVETETVLNLVEGHKNTQNGHLLRGVTYSLSQVISEQTKPSVSHVGLRKPVQIKPRDPIGGLRINAVTTTATTEDADPFVDVTSADSFDGTKQYILVNERSTTEGLLTTETYTANLTWGTRLKINGLNTHGTVSADTTALWTIAANGDGTYAIKHGDQYLTLDYNSATNTASAGLTDTATSLNLARPGNYWYITNAEGEYLSNVGGFVNGFYGAAGFNEQGGSGWKIFELETNESEQPEDSENPEDIFQVYDGFSLNNWVNGGKYYIQGARASYNNVASWITIENGAVIAKANQSDATLFTLTINDDGTCYLAFEDGETTKYLSLSNTAGTNGEAITTEPVAVTIDHITPSLYNANNVQIIEDDGNLLNLGSNGNYLNQFGGKNVTVYGAHNVADDNGNALWFHLVTDDAVSKVTVTNHYVNAKLVMFPVTMFNYEMDTMNDMTNSMYEEGSTLYNGIHFSNGTPANKNSVTYAVTAHTGEYTNGQYVIQNYKMKDSSQPSWLTCTLEGEKGITSTSNQADAAIWTLTRRPGANVFTLTTEIDGTTYYMTMGNETSGVTTDYSEITLVYYTHTNSGIQITKDGYYLAHSEGNLFCGSTNSTSDSNGMGFFPVAEDGTIGTTARTVTTINGAVTSGFSRWNWWSYLEDNDAAQNKFFAELVQHELDENGDIVFNVPEPGIFKTGTGENIADKDVYTNVGLPFVLNESTGVYSFDSDHNGVYFSDKDGDGDSDPVSGTETDLELLTFELGKPQGWTGMRYGDGSSNLWAPFNTNANDTAENKIDYHFGMRADIPFSMTPNGRIKSTDDNSDPITFTFSGDDDVWVFIDGYLVIDLGGIHNRIGATIDFANNTITYFLPESNESTAELGCYNDRTRYPLNPDGKTITVKLYNDAEGEGSLGQTRLDFSSEEAHTMSIFYMERGKGTSNCHIDFNLPMRDTVLVTKDITKSWSEEQDAADGDGEENDGTAPLTAKEQAAVDKLDFYFRLYKKDENGNFTVVANTNYYLLDKDGNVVDTLPTAADGKFALKNGQTAKFMTDFSRDGTTYYVEELDLDLSTFLTPDYNYAGLATQGFYFEGYALDVTSDEENATIHKSGRVTDASHIEEHELPLNAQVLKSYDITTYGSIEAIDSLEFICTNYLNAELPNPTARAYEDIIVIDYGLPVQIDPLRNDLFRGDDIEIVAWGDESLELNEVLDASNNNFAVPDGTEGGTSWTCDELTAVPAARLGSSASYDGDFIDIADCLFTFTQNEDGTYVISSTDADGNTVYLQPYASNNGYPVVSSSVNVTIGNGATDGTVTLQGNGGYLHFYRNGNNRYDRVKSTSGFAAEVSFYLYAEQEDGTYAPISGKDAIGTNKQYLIVADAGDHGKFITYPTTSRDTYYTQIAKLTTLDNTYTFDFGNVTFKDVTYSDDAHDTFEYRLTEQLTEVEEIRYIIKVTSTTEQEIDGEIINRTACRYALGKVYIVPATIMYYEENFSNFITFEGTGWDEMSTVSNAENVSPYQEPGVVGTATDSTYGSDVAYLSDNGDSNGTYRYADTSNKASRFTYTFTGTGTTIFARTSATTGYIQVKLYNGTDTTSNDYKTYYVDTYWKDENNTDLDKSGTLYNIPVFTEENLPYGTYTIVCTIAKAGTLTDGNPNGSGNEFFLDGIRIMQPLNELSERTDLTAKALKAYTDDGEANLDTVTLRDKLINDVKYGESNWTEDAFAVLTDIDGAIVNPADFIAIGPNEEVYLAPGQKVTFSLKAWQPEGLKLYMGMKAPFGTARVNVGHENIRLNNAPDCYRDITNNYTSLVPVTENGETYYVVTYTFEATESIVSLTNIKVVGNYEFVIIPESTN